MPSPVAFSITWAQLNLLRSLPKPVPSKGNPPGGACSLIAKGLAAYDAAYGELAPTLRGRALLEALDGLARSEVDLW